jgi:TonB-linked SusC/RagA family outer membrane protein
MKRKLTMMLMCMMMAVTALAQTAISGTVISAQDGEPVIGAAVKVKGASQGVVTNIDGKFSINVEAGKTLVFSYVGMQTKEAAAKNGMTITLAADETTLDEVMVVAYGTTTKKSFTGSASSLRAGDLSLEKASLVKSLEGKMAGVNVGGSTGDPGADQKIQIRGIGSINGSTQPLYVVDGIPVLSDRNDMTSGLKSQSILSTINPDDIESMTVLKDAAAASLYGSRAANGVIIITTKRGKAGGTKITYDGEVGWSNIAVPSALKMMNAKQLKQYWQDAFQGYFVTYENMSEEEAREAAIAEINTPWEEGGYFHDPTCATSTDWSKEIYHNGLQTNHQVGMSGGTENTQFFASFGYNKVEGTVKGSEFERYSGRLNLDHKVNN